MSLTFSVLLVDNKIYHLIYIFKMVIISVILSSLEYYTHLVLYRVVIDMNNCELTSIFNYQFYVDAKTVGLF